VDRSGAPGAAEDKGAEACVAALATAVLLRGLRSAGDAVTAEGAGVREPVSGVPVVGAAS